MRALVTGATGFLGINIVHYLHAKGVEIHAFRREGSNCEPLKGIPINWYEADVLQAERLINSCPDEVDWLFHIAADTSMWRGGNTQQTAINVQGTKNVLAMALEKKIRRMIHTSSITAYGIHHGQIIDETTPQTGGECFANYYRTKYQGEQAVKQAVAQDGLDAVILNPCHLVGAWDTRNWSQMIAMVANKNLPAVPPGFGSFCHIKSVAKAHIAAAEKGKRGENYILSGIDASFVEFIDCIAEVVNQPVTKKPLPTGLLRTVAQVMSVWSALTGREPDLTPEKVLIVCDDLRVSSAKAQQELGYDAKVSLHTMLTECYEWMLEQGHLKA